MVTIYLKCSASSRSGKFQSRGKFRSDWALERKQPLPKLIADMILYYLTAVVDESSKSLLSQQQDY